MMAGESSETEDEYEQFVANFRRVILTQVRNIHLRCYPTTGKTTRYTYEGSITVIISLKILSYPTGRSGRLPFLKLKARIWTQLTCEHVHGFLPPIHEAMRTCIKVSMPGKQTLGLMFFGI